MSTLIAAHRGASARLDDNSLEAFTAAIALGADLIETDVRADRSGALVLSHDPVRPRDRAPVALEQLVALAAGRIALNLELKQPGLERRVLAALRPRPAGLLVSSFLPEALGELRQLDAGVRTGLLVQGGRDPFRRAAACDAQAVIAEIGMVDADLLQAAASTPLELWAWTVNDPAELRRLLAEPSITGIITDEPALALQLRE